MPPRKYTYNKKIERKKAPPWNWDRDPTWTVNTRPNGGSDKSCDQSTLLTDTVVVRYLCLHEAYCVHPKDVEKRIPLGKTSLGPKARMDCRPPLHTDTFLLPGQVISAYLLRLLLIRAGDIETNPGPACHACNKTLRPSQAFLTCSNPNCDTASHKLECCSGIKRAALQTDTWLCIDCGGAQPISRPNSRTAQNAVILVGQIVSASPTANLQGVPKRSCLVCDRSTRPSLRPLICAGCLRECHKSCSSLSRTEQEMYILAGS